VATLAIFLTFGVAAVFFSVAYDIDLEDVVASHYFHPLSPPAADLDVGLSGEKYAKAMYSRLSVTYPSSHKNQMCGKDVLVCVERMS
jgi:hypothetical protein